MTGALTCHPRVFTTYKVFSASVSSTLFTTRPTSLGVAAEGRRPAGRDGPEGAVLPPGQPLGLAHGGPVGADEGGEFDPALLRRRGRGAVQPLQR